VLQAIQGVFAVMDQDQDKKSQYQIKKSQDQDKKSQDQDKKSLLLALPVELLVYIISFLSSLHDRINLRYVSRWLRSMVEGTPLLWKEFVWPYFNSQEEYKVKEVLKRCGQHVKVLSFPYCRVPSTLVEILQYCSNVQRISLPLTKLDNELITKVLNYTACLQALDLQTVELNRFSQGDFQTLLIIVSHLNELIVNVDCNGCLLDYLSIWMNENCRPPNFNVFCTTRGFMGMHLNSRSFICAGATANVKLYDKSSKAVFTVSPLIPFFQMHFEESGHLTTPCVKLSDYGILGLEEDVAVMSDSCYGRRTVHAVRYRNKHIVKRLSWMHSTKFYNPICTTHFAFSYCYSLHSGHLEQLAIACPNLQRLTLKFCDHCLESLQGLKAIASHCHYLQGLNLCGIHASKVEDDVALWEILSKLRLTHLAVGLCLLRSEGANRERLICLYQKCWTITAIQYESCNSCGDFTPKDAVLVSYFPSLNHCYLMLDSTYKFPNIVQEMISNCRTLKSASFIASYALSLNLAHNLNLQQLYIDSLDTIVPDDFMTSVSADGGLVHVVMRIESFLAEDMICLVKNSPNLMTLEIHTHIIRCKSIVGYENINVRLQEEVHSFRLSGHFLVHKRDDNRKELKILYEQGTNLLPLWN